MIFFVDNHERTLIDLVRIIRTNSGNFREDHDQQNPNSFQRGSLRATTTAGKTSIKPLRYQSNKSLVQIQFVHFSAVETTFSRWQTEQVVNWLYGIGLGQYAGECRKHFKNGLQLLHASPQELEKVSSMKIIHSLIRFLSENRHEKSITSKETSVMFEWSMYTTN